jgi:hypothetical protein
MGGDGVADTYHMLSRSLLNRKDTTKTETRTGRNGGERGVSRTSNRWRRFWFGREETGRERREKKEEKKERRRADEGELDATYVPAEWPAAVMLRMVRA